MADLRNHEALVEQVARARKAVSRRPDIKFPTGNFNQIGTDVYAYSGERGVSNVEMTMLEGVTTSDYYKGGVQLGSKAGENEDYEFKVYFNDLVVFSALFGNQGQHNIGAWPVPLIIPPYTKVKMTLDNIADADTRTWTVHFIGEAKQ